MKADKLEIQARSFLPDHKAVRGVDDDERLTQAQRSARTPDQKLSLRIASVLRKGRRTLSDRKDLGEVEHG